eukprot:sb/3467570/
MDIKLLNTRNLSRHSTEQVFSASNSYIAVSSGAAIAVFALDISDKEIVLLGHTDTVSFLHFSAPNILISASSDSLLSWNLDEARTAANSGRKPSSVYIGVGLGFPKYISTLKNTILLAVGKEVVVLDTSRGSTKFLEGHEADVIFCSLISPTQVLSLSRDNNMKIWCLEEKRAISQFHLFTSAPFTEIFFDIDTLYMGTRLKRINVENYLPSAEARSDSPSDSDTIYAQPRRYLTKSPEDVPIPNVRSATQSSQFSRSVPQLVVGQMMKPCRHSPTPRHRCLSSDYPRGGPD